MTPVDSNGNTLTKVDSTGTTTYAWDFENRLTSVTLPGGGGTVSFKYDPFGKRIYKSSPGGTSIFAYDGDNLIEETDAAGAVVARYSQGLNVDEPFAELPLAPRTESYDTGIVILQISESCEIRSRFSRMNVSRSVWSTCPSHCPVAKELIVGDLPPASISCWTD